MRENIFLTIIKWWCNCLDLCFEILARPWNEEELPYRRVLCSVYGQPWHLKKSFKLFDATEIPTSYAETRKRLTEFTRDFWNNPNTRQQMTPSWPAGAIEYLEEFITEASKKYEEVADEKVIRAFRMIHGLGEDLVPKPLVAEKLGVTDKQRLYVQVGHLMWHLREWKSGILKSFAFQGGAPSPDLVLYWWRENKKIAAFEARLKEWGGQVPDHFLNMTVEEPNFSVRTYNCLKNNNIQTIGELLTKTENELLKTKNFGRKSLNEVRDVLRELDPGFEIGVLAKKKFPQV